MTARDDETITRLYAAMDAKDGAGMTACYAPDATFEDPAFGRLKGPEVGGMWRMLMARAQDFSVEVPEHHADGGTGSAHWIATYAFGPKRRRVVNDVRASFTFTPEGLIATHVDSFDLRRWAAQAISPIAGHVMGRTPLLKLSVNRGTRKQLGTFMASEA